MLTSAPPLLQFPDRSALLPVTVIPLYVELKPHSGERVCGGVVVVDERGAVTVEPVAALSRLRCVYGDGTRVLELARDVALESLARYLAASGTPALDRWQSPVEGIVLGPTLATATTSIKEQIRAALLEFSSLEAFAEEPPAEETSAEHGSAAQSVGRLLSAIEKVVAAAKPERLACFNRAYRVRPDARPLKLGYVGKSLVANFTAVFPMHLAAGVNLSKARLWDLAQAREGSKHGWFTDAHPSHYELLIHRPTEQNVEYTHRQLVGVAEALAELEAEADRIEIHCRPLSSPEDIAAHLLTADA